MRKISLGHFNISDRGRDYVDEVLDTGRLSYGPFTERFEAKFAKMHDCKYGVFCNSGTSALHISLLALKEIHEWKDGDEVLVPATTFIATSNAVLHAGLRPVFVDVESDTFNMDPEQIEGQLSHRTVAVMPVHLFGLPANMPKITAVAKKYDLKVIEDSCEAVNAEVLGKKVGSFGHAAAFSTYVAHFIVGGVGGVVTTNNAEVAQLCRSYMAHGRDNIYTSIDHDDSTHGHILGPMIERRFRFERLGYSFRATELEAAIALSELERIDENIKIRNRNAATLTGRLQYAQDVLRLPVSPEGFTRSYMMYPMLFLDEGRDKFLLHLEENGIETRLLFPLLSQPIYKELFPGEDDYYPVARLVAEQGFFIGMHQGMTARDMHYIADTIYAGIA